MGVILSGQKLDERMRELEHITIHTRTTKPQRPGARKQRPMERRRQYLLETGRYDEYAREFGENV